MVDKKDPDENLFSDNFENDFDFGEEPLPPETEATASKQPSPNTGKTSTSKLVILTLAGIGIAGFTLYMGWTFLNKPPATESTKLSKTTQTSTKPTDASVLSKTTQAQTSPETTVAPIPKPESTVITAPPELAPQLKPKPKAENPLNEIAQAFSSADQTPPPEKQNATIGEIQKELFTSTQTTSNEPPKTQQMNDAVEIMTKLSQQMDYTINQIKQLDAYTREISQTIAKLNTDISAMDNRILAVTNATSSLSKDLGQVKSEVNRHKPGNVVAASDTIERMDEELFVAKRRQAAPGCPMPEEPEYMVHAVIPGRAWLKTSKGQIVTVTEGETVGNYGKVLVIDAANGVVLTNSGITFR